MPDNSSQWEIRAGIATKIKKFDESFEITTDNEGTFILSSEDNPKAIIPKVGDKVTLYTSNWSLIHGLDINDERIYYKTKEEWEKDRNEAEVVSQLKKQAELDTEREDRDRRRLALPPAFQRRLNRFEAANPVWRREYESYELFVCEQAASLAQLPKDKSTEEWYKWFEALKYDKQKEVWPDMSDEHSGNTFGTCVGLAQLFELGNEWFIENSHGAIAILVGCEEYGCHKEGNKIAARPSGSNRL